jgi:dipeptidyl-peptidase-4
MMAKRFMILVFSFMTGSSCLPDKNSAASFLWFNESKLCAKNKILEKSEEIYSFTSLNSSAMKRVLAALGLIGLFSVLVTAQEDAHRITLESIYTYDEFTPSAVRGIRSMNDGEHYTVSTKGKEIIQYAYSTGKPTDTLFNAAGHADLEHFDGYALNADETLILLTTETEPIYRRSSRSTYYVFDRASGSLQPLSLKGKQQLAAFSPDNTAIAFVRDNNIFLVTLPGMEESQITFDGKKNEIINGAPDWVYEEEFGFADGFKWSPDGKRIAFYRTDERLVKEFFMTLFGDLYPEAYRFKYPKAGETNSQVEILVYDLETGTTITMDTDSGEEHYIPRIKWTNDPKVLSITRLNRHQNHVEILHSDAQTGVSNVVYEEFNERYISEATDDMITYLPDNESFLLISEQSGYFHFYRYNFIQKERIPVTSGSFDISSLLAIDFDRELLYYTSYEESPIEQHIYSIKLNGKGKKKISERSGYNSAVFSTGCAFYILNHSDANTPPSYALFNRKGREIRILEDNSELRKKQEEYAFGKVEFMKVPTASGQLLNGYMIKPADFDPDRQYPLFMYVYGGPESQNVTDSWNSRMPWFQLLLQEGYIVACVDNRGTNGQGEAFRKATYMQLGKLETIDQVESATYLSELPYIDAERIGIFGWSYGGFMTNLCMIRGNGLFRMGISVAPVTNWRYYDTIYTERFMRTPQENPEGYDLNSPINYADQLQGKLLLVHGTADDNVHYQNSIDFISALVSANKQFEMQFYPNKNHSIYGGNTRLHLYTRMTDFIRENL